jgi:hypothetical protein
MTKSKVACTTKFQILHGQLKELSVAVMVMVTNDTDVVVTAVI